MGKMGKMGMRRESDDPRVYKGQTRNQDSSGIDGKADRLTYDNRPYEFVIQDPSRRDVGDAESTVSISNGPQGGK